MKLRKLFFNISVILLIIWIVIPILMSLFNIEFTETELKNNYIEFRFYSVPIAIIFTLFGTLDKKDKIIPAFIKILATFFVSGLVMIVVLFAGMCGSISRNTIYVNKQNKNLKIVERSVDCGAYDSGTYVWQTYKVKPLTDYFLYAAKIDTTTLDKNKWIKVD